MTTRDIVVAGALPRHQMRKWLDAHKLYWMEDEDATIDASTFYIHNATDEQWGQIQEWVRKVTG